MARHLNLIVLGRVYGLAGSFWTPFNPLTTPRIHPPANKRRRALEDAAAPLPGMIRVQEGM